MLNIHTILQIYYQNYHTGEKSVVVLPIQLFIFEKKINQQNKKIECKNKTAEIYIYTVFANKKCLYSYTTF